MKAAAGEFMSSKAFSDGLWSLGGTILGVVASLAVVKIITSMVGSSEYGQASLVLGIVALLNGFLVGPLMVAHLRLYFDYVKKGMGDWYANAFRKILLTAGAVAFAVYVLLALGFYTQGNLVYLQMIGPVSLLVLAQPFVSARTNYLEAGREQRRLALFQVTQKSILPAVLFLLLLSHLEASTALILAQAVVLLLVLIGFHGPAQDRNSEVLENSKPSRAALNEAIKSFGWSLPAGYVVMWVVTTSDRYLLEYFTTLDTVGVYTMNYGFWSMPFMLLNGWLEIWTRPVIYKAATDGDWERVKWIVAKRSGLGGAASLAGILLIALLVEEIQSIMLGDQYKMDVALIMLICAGHAFMVLGYSMVAAFLAAKKTGTILAATAAAAVCNLAVNFLAIPVHGAGGAAFATLIAYVVWSALLCMWLALFFRRRPVALVSDD